MSDTESCDNFLNADQTALPFSELCDLERPAVQIKRAKQIEEDGMLGHVDCSFFYFLNLKISFQGWIIQVNSKKFAKEENRR